MTKTLLRSLSVFLFALSTPAHSLHIYCEDDTVFQFRRPDGKLGGMVIELVTEIQKRVGNTESIMKAQEYIAISKNTDVQVAAKWNAALESMKKDGTFTAIFRKYYRDYPLPGPEIVR